ncbi:exportin-7 isoform X1, partial [Tanacetum coccineum]
MTGFRSCTSRSHYRSVSKQTTRYPLLNPLAGNYVNFGVFELYGDRALADALGIALKMTLSVPLADILAYRRGIGAVRIYECSPQEPDEVNNFYPEVLFLSRAHGLRPSEVVTSVISRHRSNLFSQTSCNAYVTKAYVLEGTGNEQSSRQSLYDRHVEAKMLKLEEEAECLIGQNTYTVANNHCPVPAVLQSASMENVGGASNPSPGRDHGRRPQKRPRTNLTKAQKGQMLSFSQASGWRIQKEKEALMHQFCREI